MRKYRRPGKIAEVIAVKGVKPFFAFSGGPRFFSRTGAKGLFACRFAKNRPGSWFGRPVESMSCGDGLGLFSQTGGLPRAPGRFAKACFGGNGLSRKQLALGVGAHAAVSTRRKGEVCEILGPPPNALTARELWNGWKMLEFVSD